MTDSIQVDKQNYLYRHYKYHGQVKPLIKLAKRREKGKANAMTLVISHLLVQPHTSASLVQKIGIYGSSHISSCLRKLTHAGLIGTIRDPKQLGLVYYNIKLEQDKPSLSETACSRN
jgi:hypothetical protein